MLHGRNVRRLRRLCRRLAELSPCRGENQKTLLLNSGAEAIENAVKIARAATGRGAVVVFERGFHGRTLLTLAMTEKTTYKAGFGPFAPEVYRVPAPYEYRGISSNDAIAALERLFKAEVDPRSVACAVLEPVQGEGGFVPMPPDYPGRLQELLDAHGILFVADEVQSGVGRTGRMWAVEHYGLEPDLLVAGKSLGGGLPLASVTGRAELMDAPAPGGLGGTFGGNPVACAAALATLDALEEILPQLPALGHRIRGRLELIAQVACTQSQSMLDRFPDTRSRERGCRAAAPGSSFRAGSTATCSFPRAAHDRMTVRCDLNSWEEPRLTSRCRRARRTATSLRSTASTCRSARGVLHLQTHRLGKTTTLRAIAGSNSRRGHDPPRRRRHTHTAVCTRRHRLPGLRAL